MQQGLPIPPPDGGLSGFLLHRNQGLAVDTWGLRPDWQAVCLQQVSGQYSAPAPPAPSAMKPQVHLAVPLAAQNERQGEASAFSEFPASLWASGGAEEPGSALRMNSLEAGRGHAGTGVFTATTHG